MPVLVSRIGKERLYTEAIESHISGWFWNAAARTGIRPADRPELDYELPSSDSEDWRFTATVPVLPKPALPDWTQIEVPAPDAEVPSELIEAELDALRGTVAELVPADRPAQAGDTIVVDLVREDGQAQRDYVVELGAGRLLPELEEQLIGMAARESRELRFEQGDDNLAVVTATVKEVKEKVLPPLDDELARAASEFDTFDELRGEIEGRLREQVEAQVDEAFRRATLDAVVDATNVDPAGPLVDARTRTLVREMDEMMRRRGASLDTYLQVTGGSAEELVARLHNEAQRSVAGEEVTGQPQDPYQSSETRQINPPQRPAQQFQQQQYQGGYQQQPMQQPQRMQQPPGPGAPTSAPTSSRPSGERRSIWIERLPLLRPAQ